MKTLRFVVDFGIIVVMREREVLSGRRRVHHVAEDGSVASADQQLILAIRAGFEVALDLRARLHSARLPLATALPDRPELFGAKGSRNLQPRPTDAGQSSFLKSFTTARSRALNKYLN